VKVRRNSIAGPSANKALVITNKNDLYRLLTFLPEHTCQKKVVLNFIYAEN
jgi:hypothetical protein